LRTDAITHRIGAGGSILAPLTQALAGHLFLVTYDLTTDSHYRKDVRGWTAQYSPVAPRLGIGQLQPADGPLKFSWRPYVGLETGHVSDAVGDPDLMTQSDSVDLYVKVASQMRAFDRIVVTPELTQCWQRKSDRASHGLVEIGIEFVISQTAAGDSRVSLEFGLAQGRRPPGFAREQSAVVALGVKF